jgi:histidine ammonia-lyase
MDGDFMRILPGKLGHDDICEFLYSELPVELDPTCWPKVDQSRDAVMHVIDRGDTVYGLNTGFGMLANQRISKDDLAQLQINLVRSHSAGAGKLIGDRTVRLIMLLKLASLARGYSGVRREVIEILVQCLNRGVIPCIPEQGSVGASGDLAPLAHMSLVLVGEGDAKVDGQIMPASQALATKGIKPLELAAKEGLALLNGTQVSTAFALVALYESRKTFRAAVIAGAMSVDAAKGSDTPFDERIHAIRNQPAQMKCARFFRQLLAGSEIRKSHLDCSRVQDPYSLRCQPQILGACLESFEHAAKILLNEANAVSDNPLVFSEERLVLSGGNFHAEPVALVADQMAIALAEVSALAERQIALLIDKHLSELPPFLTQNGGLNSGFMIPQVTAAALASENKHLSNPCSTDSLPTSSNQEDHVSMAAYAARRLSTMIENANNILAIELLAACQGIDFLKPLKTSEPMQKVYDLVRAEAAFYEQDRTFHHEISGVHRNVICGEALAVAFDERALY